MVPTYMEDCSLRVSCPPRDRRDDLLSRSERREGYSTTGIARFPGTLARLV